MWGKRANPGRPRLPAFVLGVLVVLTGMIGPAPARAADGDVGFEGPPIGSASAPTGQKPESKLWFADGSWWGILYDASARTFKIWRFDWASNTWSKTSTVVDTRTRSSSDALWDGNRLYVATHLVEGASGSDQAARLLRYSYNSTTRTYALDPGYPIVLTSGRIEALVIDRDTTGRVWATWTVASPTGGRQVMVTRSDPNAANFTAPFVLPVVGAATLDSDDISTLVAYDGRIGILWSNQRDSTVYFASHVDGEPDNAWTVVPALQGKGYADDHLNIKSLQADPAGRVFAAVKTSLNDNGGGAQQPLILLLILDGTGSWQRRTFSTVAYDQTRPLVLVNPENRSLYMFAAGPCCSGGVVYYKETSLDAPNFAAGPGDPFIKLAANTTINNPMSTKQPLTNESGLLVMAGDDHTHRYVYNRIDFGGGDQTPPDTLIDSGPSGVVSSTTATFAFRSTEPASTFACSLDAGAFTSCTSPRSYTGLAEGDHTFRVRATDAASNVDPTPATATWTIDTSVPDTTPPSVNLSAPANGARINGPVAVAATASDNVGVDRVEFSVGGTVFATDTTSPYGATWDPGSTPDGPVTITATAVDAAGLDASDSATVTLDRSAPDTIIDTGPSGTVTSGSASFTFHATEAGATFACSTDGGSWAACSSPAALSGLANGSHTFAVRATDLAGNADPTPATRTWTVDAPTSAFLVDGFESGTFTGAAWQVVTGGDGSATVQGNIVRTGAFAARLSETANTSSVAYARGDLGGGRMELTASASVRIDVEGASGGNVPLLRLFDATGKRLLVLYRQNLASNKLWVTDSLTTRTETTGVLPLGTWARYDVHVVINGASSTIDVRLNGATIMQTTTANLGTVGVRWIQLGNDTSKQTFTLYADDVSVVP
jgi:hypothetical protein